MLGLFASLILSLIACAPNTPVEPAHALQVTYRTYSNARYDYSIAYPVGLLLPQGESDNGDGQKFLSDDGRAKMTVFGAQNLDNESTQSAYKKMQLMFGAANGSEVTYKVIKGNWFVVSGRHGNDIFYAKTVHRGRTLITFILSYPAEERQTFDPIAEHIAQSFSR
ncbi:MAG: hypothetical protein JO360_15090 [Acidobacteria bacterium]|nr:hypothetical protein [Acidobacteriota bacterium]